MAVVCATLIVKNKLKFKAVPPTLVDQVREILINLDCEHLIVE